MATTAIDAGDIEKQLRTAVELAGQYSTAKALYEAVNRELGIDRSQSGWRRLTSEREIDGRKVNVLIRERMNRATIVDQEEEPDDDPFDVEEFFELSVKANQTWQKRNRAHNRSYARRRIETSAPIAICFSSDWHVGGAGTEHFQIRTDNRIIAEHPRLFAYLGGDWSNNYVIPVLMHAGMEDVFAAGDQQYVVCRYLWSILAETDSILAVGDGNHTDWVKRMAGVDPSWFLPDGLRHLYTKYGSVLGLTVGNQFYRIFRRHRNRFHSIFNPAHAVVAEAFRGPWDFDIGVVEHQHQPHIAWFDSKYRDPENGDFSTKRIAIRTGTYKTHDSFAKTRGYHYGSSDMPCVILWPDTFRMQPVIGLQNCIDILEGLD